MPSQQTFQTFGIPDKLGDSHKCDKGDSDDNDDHELDRDKKLDQVVVRGNIEPIMTYRATKQGNKSLGNDANNKHVDSGYAWLVLSVLFCIKSIGVGTFLSYGLIFAETLKQSSELTRQDLAWRFATLTTVENFASPFVSLLTFYLSWRQIEFIAAVLTTCANLGAFLSHDPLLDILFIGVIEGIGMSFLVTPIMAINNAYFLRYRSTAYGLVSSGPYVGALVLSLITSRVIKAYGLRYAYLVLGCVNAINLILSLFIRSIPHHESSDCHIKTDQKVPETATQSPPSSGGKVSLGFAVKTLLSLLKNPYFHMIWLTQLIFYWHYSSMSMLIVDYGNDKQLSNEQSEHLLTSYSVGAFAGRLVPAFFLDLKLIKPNYITAFTCAALATTLISITWVPNGSYITLMALVTLLGCLISFIYVLINLLNVEYLGNHIISLSFGLSALIDGMVMMFRPMVIGYCRDVLGDYNYLYIIMYSVTMTVGFSWLIFPMLIRLYTRQKAMLHRSPQH